MPHNRAMNKTILVVLAAVGILLAVLIGFATFNRSKSPKTETTNGTNNQEAVSENEVAGQTNSLRSLLGAGGSQECTYEDAETKTSGTIYVGNGRMRGDVAVNSTGSMINSHMISDGKFIYIWTDDSEDGVKMSLAKSEDLEGSAQTSQSVNLDQQMNYNCKGWSVDNTKFNLPSINFQDLSAMMNNPVDSGNQCQVCDSLDGEEASACRSALGC